METGKFVYLTVEKWRIVIHICNFNCEGAHSFKARLAGISCLNSHTNKLAIFAFTVEHFVGEYLTGFFIDAKFGTLLVWLLNDTVLNLQKDQTWETR